MTQEQKEYVVLRTLFVVFCTLIGAAIGIWFSWQLAVGLGLFQFALCMGLTRKRIAMLERYPYEDTICSVQSS